MTIAEFVERSFLPEHIVHKGTPGRRHYQAILKHILNPDLVDRMFRVEPDRSRSKLKPDPEWPYIDHVALRHLRSDDVAKLMSVALRRGYSTQTVKHIRSAVSAILSYAIKGGYYSGMNPAMQVALPGMQRKTPHTLTFSQTVEVLQAMRYPEWEITVMALLTGMTIAEICGLQWKYVNLTTHATQREGETIPPMSIAIRRQWYRGELSVVPKGRKKDVPVPMLFRQVFVQLGQAKNAGWNDFVLVSRSGKPINQINIAARRLKAIGERLNLPWLSWQVFRRTRSKLLSEYGSMLEYELALAVTMKLGFRPRAEGQDPST
jgi:integrase